MIQFHSQSAFAPAVSAGSIAYLSDDGSAIGVGADVETLAAFAQAVAAKDRKAYEHLFQDGRAFLVTDRVRVLVISLKGTAQKFNSWKATTLGSRDSLFASG